MINIENAGLRLAVYTRVSTGGIPLTLKSLNRKSLPTPTVGLSLMPAYKDEGWSGSMMARPPLDRLTERLRGTLLMIIFLWP